MSKHADELYDAIEQSIRKVAGGHFTLRAPALSTNRKAGCTLTVGDGDERFFVKAGTTGASDRLSAEIDGLKAIQSTRTFRTPQVMSFDGDDRQAVLVLEYLDMHPPGSAVEGARFATALATLHRSPGEIFGWHRDNFIGLTPQCNTPESSWPRFFAEHRLKPQLMLACENGFSAELKHAGERLLARIPALFLDYRPQPGLLHGDLWHGNAGITAAGEAALFDPACYYGDRETDLAMTELFGGFPTAFYAAYRKDWPLNDGFEQRKPLYALYHILNHLNLFGRAYLREAEKLLSRLNQALAGNRA